MFWILFLTAQDGSKKVDSLETQYLQRAEDVRMGVQTRGKNGQNWILACQGKVQEFIRPNVPAFNEPGCSEDKNPNYTDH